MNKLDEKFINAKEKIQAYEDLLKILEHCIWNWKERNFPHIIVEDVSDEYKQKRINEIEKNLSQEFKIPDWIKSEIKEIRHIPNKVIDYEESLEISFLPPNNNPYTIRTDEEDIEIREKLFEKVMK